MITKHELNRIAAEWGLRDVVVEKDYVLGWVLWGIGSNPRLSREWIFKGGTCLKKCFIETHRFSEDLDFTVRPGTVFGPVESTAFLRDALRAVQSKCGVEFELERSFLRIRPSGQSAEGRIYFRGPGRARDAARLKLDLTLAEKVVRQPVNRKIRHPYSDRIPPPDWVLCYSFEELFAEKIRAMGERSRPRDLYDIITLFRRRESLPHSTLFRDVFEKKCRAKGVPVYDAAAISSSELRHELRQEWQNMLGHQLPALPEFESYWNEIPLLFEWLEGIVGPEELASSETDKDTEIGWFPQPDASALGGQSTLELIRFAATNLLSAEIQSDGDSILVEPYSLHRSSTGWLFIRVIERGTGVERKIRIDRIDRVRVHAEHFSPKYAIDFGNSRFFEAPPSPPMW